ncbi:MAG: glycosyltransferase family 4 protein [Friedmanniella sp.]
MRIAEVLTASTGGIGRHVASLAPRLAALGHDVTVYCPGSTAAAHDFGAGAVRPLRDLRQLRDVDVVHAHGYKAAALVLPWTRCFRIPLVVTWHNAVLAGGWPGRAGRLLQSVVARGADLTLGASEDLVRAARAHGARRARIAPVAAPRLPAPVVPRQQYRAALGLPADALVVVTVGRLAPQKNLAMVLDVAAAVRDHPRLHFVLAGEGPLRDELTERIRVDGSRVRLLGAVADMASLLAAADVMLLTSFWEARALVAQEALLAGVPLVSTRVGGIEELVGEAAVLVEVGDVPAVVAALEEAADHPERWAERREAGRRRARSWPDEDEVARDLAATYTELSRGAAGRSTTRGQPT